MNIHEYQAKEILKSFGVKIQNGLVASTTKEALDNAKMIVNNNRSNILVLNPNLFNFFCKNLIIPESLGVIVGNLISSLAKFKSSILDIIILLKDHL